MASTAPLLDFTTLIETQHVRIDGALYPLRHQDAMTLFQLRRLEIEAPRLGDILQLETLTAADEEEAGRLLRSACRVVLDAPEDVQTRMSDMQRIKVMQAFTALQSTQAQTAGAAGAPRRTGANGSRGSNGSTAATPKRGSRGSRSH